jgi:hypothetical protein
MLSERKTTTSNLYPLGELGYYQPADCGDAADRWPVWPTLDCRGSTHGRLATSGRSPLGSERIVTLQPMLFGAILSTLDENALTLPNCT